MSSFIFVQQDAEFSVKVAVGTDKNNPKFVYADQDKENLIKGSPDVNPDTIEEHEVFFKYPNFGDASKILDKSVEMSNDEFQFNISSVRMFKMIALVKRWTFKDSSGNPVKPTTEAIKSLHPTVAAVIGVEMDNTLGRANLA